MTIIRDHSYFLVCLAAACGGSFEPAAELQAGRTSDIAAATADSPAQGGVVCDHKVALFGRSSAPSGSAVVASTWDAKMVRRTCSATVAKDQTWSCTQTLADGGYTWSAQVASNGPVSQQNDFVVSTGKYPAPTIDHTPSPNNDAKPILTGTVDSALVNHSFYLEVTENGKSICVVSPIKSTNWACPLATRLADGPHVLSVDVDYPNGDEATPSGNPNAFVIKTSIAKPTFTDVPSPTSSTAILFSGSGEPAATVTVAQSGGGLCQAAVSAAGRWSCMAPQPLAEGTHAVTATQQDAAGNTSAAASISFVIDTHVPRAPTLEKADSRIDDPHVAFSGSGEPSAQVSVVDSYSRLLCSAAVNAQGAWSCAPAAAVADGDYLVIALQVTAVGNRSGPSDAISFTIRTLRTPLFDALASPTRQTAPLLSGHAQAGAAVSVFLGEQSICSAVADASGAWTCRPDPLADGAYLFQARVNDSSSHTSAPSVARAVVIDTTAPAAPVLGQPETPTRQHQPVLSGTAEAGASVIVSDATSGAALCTATASAAGAFHCAPSAVLPLGDQHVTATATDAAGNGSLPAQAVGFTISEATPSRPTIEEPANGASVDKLRPLIEGHTAPGTLVEVLLDGASYIAQVSPDGRWTLLPPEDLKMGGHQIVASATDPGQNVSDAVSSGFSIVETGLARGGCSSGGLPTPALAVAALLWALRRRRRMAPAAAVLALAGAPAVVRAQNIDVSLFRPATGGDGLVAVEGARPPLPGEAKLELRTWTDYAVQPLSYVTSSGQQALVKNRAAQWLGAQVHLIGPLSLAAQMPITLSESGDLSSLPGSSQGPSQLQSGFGDLRLTPRLGLLRQEDSGIDLAFQMSFELPTAQAQSLTSDGGVRLEGLVALGRRLTAVPAGALDLLTNAYLRSRPERQLLDVKTGTEAGLRAGLGYAIDSAKRWIPSRVYAEFEARTVLRAGFAGGTAPAEWRMGTTVCPAGNLAIDFAGGTALTDGIGAPKARFIFGIGWSAASCNRGFARAAPPPAPAPAVVVVAATPPAKPVAQALPLPPPDRDGDGIPDAEDNCPDEPGLPENQGCPHGIRQRVVVSANSLEILDRVHFATGQSKIEPRSFWLLDQVAAVLKSHPDLLVLEVEGHTDDQGGSAYNILLSHARSTAVADYLVSKGVDRARLVPHGFGPTRPVASNGTPEGRAANRRVAFTVVKTRARVIEAERPPNS